MDAKSRIELQVLKVYAAVSLGLFCLLFFIAAKGQTQKARFKEIDVERINIIEKDGTLRLTISNNERSPGPVIGGLTMKSREGKRGAGLIFFNSKGDECGGMTWESSEQEGHIAADAGLMFDQYNQDQTVGMTYNQSDGERSAGLHVWERSLTPLADFARRVNEIELMKEGPERTEAMKKLREAAAAQGLGGAQRVFVGRTEKNEAVVSLADAKGKPRILLSVDAADAARLQFLDADGKVLFSLPEDPAAKKKN
ncbi:MAG: hypothetical protein A2Y86_05660 [Candidatus Aminicenantes bacterium RBG_13_62_12]|jgi:hypothetical protein|nr:MAG: hypothetical protein A2Y86_05660 [Candidatus Aminicenantes bacterium RBG_13_62_12]